MTKEIHARFGAQYPGFQLDIDVCLPGAGVSALFGHSGSGKTTCLRAMAGLVKLPDAYLQVGDMIWQDAEQGIFVLPHQRNIGYVFQEPGLFSHLSVEGNLRFGYRRIDRKDRKVKLRDITELLGISHLLARPPHTLSGGERQRVAIARALLTSPQLLLMDEPLSALDGRLKAEILPYLERLHTELAIPIIYVSHSIDEVARLADHMVMLENGKVIANDKAQHVMVQPQYQHIFGEGLSSIFDSQITQHSSDNLTALDIQGMTLWVPQRHEREGTRYRCRVLASDVSLSLTQPDKSSILNQTSVIIKAIESAPVAGESLVVLTLPNQQALLSQITLRSLLELQLEVGQTLWAQIKAVAIC